MNSQTETEPTLDSARFRQILGHYPTGVVVVTALDEQQAPVGMVVGSFSSVSLSPPLVAFMPDKKSTTYARLQHAESFVVNVLSADQEDLCRRLAAKKVSSSWEELAWRPAASGAPILDGAVAWIECTRSAVHDGGDHHIVLGLVQRLDVGDPSLPLLFFQGGYGRFAPRSLVAPADSDMMHQIAVADVARRAMEGVVGDLGMECIAQARVGDELIHIATAGSPKGIAAPTRVGIRMPNIPPFGGLHIAWAGPEAEERWLSRSSQTSPERLDLFRQQLERLRTRGFSLGLAGPRHAVVEDSIKEFSTGRYTPELEARLRRLMEGLGDHYEPEALSSGQRYDVRFIGAPIFGADGQVEVALKLFSLPTDVEASTIDRWAQRLVEAADSVTDQIDGRNPRIAGTQKPSRERHSHT